MSEELLPKCVVFFLNCDEFVEYRSKCRACAAFKAAIQEKREKLIEYETSPKCACDFRWTFCFHSTAFIIHVERVYIKGKRSRANVFALLLLCDAPLVKVRASV